MERDWLGATYELRKVALKVRVLACNGPPGSQLTSAVTLSVALLNRNCQSSVGQVSVSGIMDNGNGGDQVTPMEHQTELAHYNVTVSIDQQFLLSLASDNSEVCVVCGDRASGECFIRLISFLL